MFLKKKQPNNELKISNPKELLHLIAAKNLAIETNIGVGREKNEDFCAAGANQFNNQILIVCDGLGGYQGGQEASRIVGEMIINSFLENDFNHFSTDQIKKWFVNTINRSKFHISEFITKNPHCYKMATTLACYIITDTHVFGFNMGDSRLYAIKNNKLIQISDDQNFLNYLLSKNIQPDTINEYGAQVYSIINYIGQFDETELKYDFYCFQKQDSFDWIFITSDGVHSFVSENEILQIFEEEKASGLYKTAITLVNQALSNLSNDNLSIAIAKMHN